MDDSHLPVRSRDRRGLPHRGKPMKVKVYTPSGIKVAVWIVPSTALAGLLHEKVAQLYFVNPGRVSLVLMQKGGRLIERYGKGLVLVAKYEPVISVQVIIRVRTAEEEDSGDWGWRRWNNWRRLLVKVGMSLQLSSMVLRKQYHPLWEFLF